MTSNRERKISSLRDLPLEIAPPRDLWEGIEGRIAAESPAAKEGIDSQARQGVHTGQGVASGARRRTWRPARMQVLAAAAVIAALAVGVWIGRAVLPGSGATSGGNSALTAANSQPGATGGTSSNRTGPAGGSAANGGPATNGGSAANSGSAANGGPGVVPVEYFMDPKYMRQRAELVKGLEARIAALPPESRDKVVHSLKAINDSKRELEAELGKDPSNALLQELLVNTYQDEMRVLTVVHEAGNTAEGI
jgi:hypothetical protein